MGEQLLLKFSQDLIHRLTEGDFPAGIKKKCKEVTEKQPIHGNFRSPGRIQYHVNFGSVPPY